jgi:regulator of replication initiation timing
LAQPTSAEYQQMLDENDALRAEIVKLKWKLENCEMIRQEQASYIRGLWEDNHIAIGRKRGTPA